MKQERILMAHGSGGLMSQRLIDEVFKQTWSNPYLDKMMDGAVLPAPGGRLVVSTDSFVITPIFFPGGDIGKLAICGTVNDLVACGAKPLYLSAAFIIEEGFLVSDLKDIVVSMARTAEAAGVQLVTGDTKVVEKGSADQVFINTTGIGVLENDVNYSPEQLTAGDKVIVTGRVGDHGLAILARREGLSFQTPAVSDCAALHQIGQVLAGFPGQVRCMRDPTRGGLATVLNELAAQAQMGIIIKEKCIPVSQVVQGACDMLGMDPLYMANEGKMVVVTGSDQADMILQALRGVPEGEEAAIIGEVETNPRGMVLLETPLGARRILGALEGEHVPRIC